ncbi:short-chain dehydrogenase/reductase family 16C member 6-like [Camponotus floridanus]|uniref:short-chain dehydrogenase/reductase family 16C member 6-like n=1 Tax=Camponotus floridanus TaxID=104421 RepID=UPI000DC669A2|nr:short-chain dehydrogenase/reductase family 16C member 6-like [Camponotus floridanus]
MKTTISCNNTLLLLVEILFLILKVFYFICKNILTMFIPITKKSVTNEIVLVTGAGHGIGKEIAIGYALLGATVICCDINEETNKQTMKEIKLMEKNAVFAYQCNVADRKEVFRMAEKIRKEIGDVTILVNNAGIAFIKTLLNQSIDEVSRVIDVNLKSHYWTLQAFLPSMIEKNHGHIVAISSIVAFISTTHGTVYSPTKSAVKALMESLSEELRAYSKGKSLIKFTTVYPALVLTGIVKKPRSRFSFIINGLTPQKAASLIIDAQRQNFRERSIPSYWLLLVRLLRCLPTKAIHCISDFLDVGVDIED